MTQRSLQFTVGENINEVLLDIAQDKMAAGDVRGAIDTYQQSLAGIPTEFIIGILKGKYALKVTDGGATVSLTDEEDVVAESRTHLRDWNRVIGKIMEHLKMNRQFITKLRQMQPIDLNSYKLTQFDEDPLAGTTHMSAICTLAARDIAGNNIADDPKFHMLGNLLEQGDTEFDELTPREKCVYCVVRYVKAIRYMQDDLIKLDRLYKSLLEYEMIDRVPFIEDEFESCLYNYLEDFYNTKKGYSHPLCDPELIALKEKMLEDMKQTTYGAEYFRKGIVAKNIMDGYDAGYLAPDGTFYGLNGHENELLHVELGDMLAQKMFQIDRRASNFDIEQIIMEAGYMKIHHDRVYGLFAFDREQVEKGERLWCPTAPQLKMISDYANKFYGGVINTDATGYNEVKISALKQMDELALRNTFRI